MTTPESSTFPGEQESSSRLRNGAMLGATLARLALIPELMDSIQQQSVGRTTMMVGAVVAADIVDGDIARRLGVDTP